MQLPVEAKGLTEETSIAIAQQIQWAPVKLPTGTVETSYVCQGEKQGENAPVLLLHGFDSSLFEFRRLVPQLIEQMGGERQVYAVDLAGFGFCDRTSDFFQTKQPTDTINPDVIRQHLAAFCQQIVGEPVVLVGASMGGGVAIDLATSHPNLVQKLVLLDAVGFAPAPVIGRFMFSPLDKWATNFLRSAKVRRKISENAYFDKSFVTPDAELCAALHLLMPNWQESLIAFTKSRGYGGLAGKIAQIEMPTLVLWGRQDKILGTKAAAKFEKILPKGELMWVEACGHVPHLEKAPVVAESIAGFLR
ncbi:MAG: alpha/beta fold hydrolase [Cyanobacteria bacterium P01_C01_bin.69]